MSPVWRVRDKLIGTFLWPGGLAASMLWFAGISLGSSDDSPNGVLLAAAAIAVIGVPLLTAFHLARRCRAF